MKRHFLIACKIIGVLQLYWAFSTFLQIGFAVGMAQTAPDMAPQRALWIVATSLYSILSFGVAYLLIFETERLAYFVGVRDETEAPSQPPSTLLRVGLQVLAVYFLLSPIPNIFKQLSDAIRVYNRTHDAMWLAHVLGYICQIGLAVTILRRTDRVIALITGPKTTST